MAVLSYGLWQRQFGGEADAIGATINIDARPIRVVGVMPRAGRIPLDSEVWMPITRTAPEWRTLRGINWDGGPSPDSDPM